MNGNFSSNISHWVALMVEVSDKNITGITLIDPMGSHAVSKGVLESFEKVKVGLDLSCVFSEEKHPQYDGNSSDCGPFLVEAVRIIMEEQVDYDMQKEMQRNTLESSREYGQQLREKHRQVLSKSKIKKEDNPGYNKKDDKDDDDDDDNAYAPSPGNSNATINTFNQNKQNQPKPNSQSLSEQSGNSKDEKQQNHEFIYQPQTNNQIHLAELNSSPKPTVELINPKPENVTISTLQFRSVDLIVAPHYSLTNATLFNSIVQRAKQWSDVDVGIAYGVHVKLKDEDEERILIVFKNEKNGTIPLRVYKGSDSYAENIGLDTFDEEKQLNVEQQLAKYINDCNNEISQAKVNIVINSNTGPLNLSKSDPEKQPGQKFVSQLQLTDDEIKKYREEVEEFINGKIIADYKRNLENCGFGPNFINGGKAELEYLQRRYRFGVIPEEVRIEELDKKRLETMDVHKTGYILHCRCGYYYLYSKDINNDWTRKIIPLTSSLFHAVLKGKNPEYNSKQNWEYNTELQNLRKEVATNISENGIKELLKEIINTKGDKMQLQRLTGGMSGTYEEYGISYQNCPLIKAINFETDYKIKLANENATNLTSVKKIIGLSQFHPYSFSLEDSGTLEILRKNGKLFEWISTVRRNGKMDTTYGIYVKLKDQQRVLLALDKGENDTVHLKVYKDLTISLDEKQRSEIEQQLMAYINKYNNDKYNKITIKIDSPEMFYENENLKIDIPEIASSFGLSHKL